MPEIDNDYWFDLARKSIPLSSEKSTKAAERLASVLLWFWAAYTAAVALGATFSNLSYPGWAVAIVLAPVPVVMLAYWAAADAQMPAVKDFHPQSAPSIRESFNRAARSSERRLRAARLLALLSAILVAAAICTVSTISPQSPYGFRVQALSTGESSILLITGNFPENTQVAIRVVQGSASRGAETAKSYDAVPVLSTSSGTVQTHVAIPFNASDAEVAATWIEDNKVRGVIRRVGDG